MKLTVGSVTPVQVALGCIKKKIKLSEPWEQASKQHSTTASALIPAWVPALISLNDGLLHRSVTKIKLYLVTV